MKCDLSLYLVTSSQQAAGWNRSLIDTVCAAVDGGVTVVQLREKEASARQFLALVLELSARLPAHVPLIINDRIDVYLAAESLGARVSGVHLGQHDLPAEQARALIGPQALLGVSAGHPQLLSQAAASSARIDYVGIGPVNATKSKANAPAPLGTAQAISLVEGYPLPAVAIGGLNESDLPQLRAAGFAGAAVVSAICSAPDPRQAATTLAQAWSTS